MWPNARVFAVALAAMACRPPASAPARPAEAMVRFRPAPPPDAAARALVAAVPGGVWDAGLARAVGEIVASARDPAAWIDVRAARAALARAGFPAQARFALARDDGGEVLAEAPLRQCLADTAGAAAVDLGLAERRFADGRRLQVLAWAAHRAEIDPLPRDLALDDTLGLRVDYPRPTETRLLLATPDGPVEDLDLEPGVTRWVDRFHAPGEYRVEVVARGERAARVDFLFSVFVDGGPPAMPPLPSGPWAPADPRAAEELFASRIAALRREHGLPPVAPFPLFDSVVREHAALMAARGEVAHAIPGLTEGIAARAAALAHPRARHHDDVVAAATAEDAFALVEGSPGHLRNLLCADCTHVSIGAALEPVLDRPPRIFVAVDLLSFPQGPPRRIDHHNR